MTLAHCCSFHCPLSCRSRSEPFTTRAGCLLLALLVVLRVLLGFFSGFKILSEVTPGILLNAIAVSVLLILGALSILGEFVVRVFLMQRRLPRYIIRTILER
jgi:hypothetical protein